MTDYNNIEYISFNSLTDTHWHSENERHPIRLPATIYNHAGAYFLTLCTEDRKYLFWQNPYLSVKTDNQIVLTEYGIAAKEGILLIPEKYSELTVDSFVIMPNHIHLLLQIHAFEQNNEKKPVNISTVIQQYKGYVSKQFGKTIWQKSFYDHVIRTKDEYRKIQEYIMLNPAKWSEDKFFVNP